MKLIDKMKDESLGRAVLYNFILGYGKDCPITYLDYVFPFIYHDQYRNEILNYKSFNESLVEMSKQDPTFIAHVLANKNQYKSLTEASIALMLIFQEIKTYTNDETVYVSINNTPILHLNEVICLGKWFSELSIEAIDKMIHSLKKKVVILDALTVGEDMDVSIYKNFGDLEVYDNIDSNRIPEVIKDADIVITNKKVLGKEQLQNANRLKLICLFATGFNNIDIDYCKDKGIRVCNVTGYSTSTVAQHTFALLFHLYEKNSYYDSYVKEGHYINDKMFTHFESKFHDLEGKTWGIVGLGNIGRRVASIAEAFGCNVHYYSTSGVDRPEMIKRVDFETLLKTSDIISIHAPLNDSTYHLFNKETLEMMKPSAYLLNLGRGPIVDENALYDALINEKISGAGLDVLEVEPMSETNPLIQIKDSTRLFITPHIAWASVEARQRVVNEVYRNIQSFLKGELRNCVNEG